MEVCGLQTHLTKEFYPNTSKPVQEYFLYFSILEADNISKKIKL